MDDAKLALKHAVERYGNAKAEHESARRRADEAVALANAAHTRLQDAETKLVALTGCTDPKRPPRYIRVGSHRVVVIKSTGVTCGDLETE